MRREAESTSGLSVVASTFHWLMAATVAAAVVLIVGNPKFTSYAFWIFSDTGQLQAVARLSFLVLLVWSFAVIRLRLNAAVAAIGTVALFLASLALASQEVRASMPMGNAEYLHKIPGTGALMIAWVVGAGAAIAIVFLIQLALSERDKTRSSRSGI